MRRTSRICLCTVSLLFSTTVATSPVLAQEQLRRMFYVGNSLTDQIMRGDQALAATQGYTLQTTKEWIPGAPLFMLWNQYNTNPPFELTTQHWDFMSLQPFSRYDIHSLPEGDSVNCMHFMNAAKGANPDIQTYIYAQWGGRDESKPIPSAAAWDSSWLYQLHAGTKKYYEDLVTAVRAGQPRDMKTVLLVPVGHVLYQLNQKFKATGSIAGYTSVWGFYNDGIHLNEAGAYVVGLTFMATTLKVDPRGVPVPATYGVIAPALVDAIQQSVYEVVFTHPMTGTTYADLVPVASVSLNPATVSLTALQRVKLTPTVAPANAANKRLQWYSSNTAAAIVDQNGQVTALGAGTATITARSLDGAKTGSCNVTVTGTLSTTSAPGVLAAWDLNNNNASYTNTTTVRATGVATGGGSLVATMGAGLDATRDINNGMYGYGLQATNLEDAFGYQEYISFVVAPEPGKLLTITRLRLAPMSQDAPAHFTIFSSVKGIMPDRAIATFTDKPPEISITGHVNVPYPVEFRAYFHRDPGVRGGMVGFGWNDGSDFSIEGSVQTLSGDNTAPSVPSGLASTPVVNAQLTLSWNASTDNMGVRGYYVYRDDTRVTALPVDATSLAMTGLSQTTNYSFTVSALDFAGNESSKSAPYALSGNRPPVAVLNATPLTGNPPLSVSFTAAGSSDPDASDHILGYEWNFGDGSPTNVTNAPTHVYTVSGTYTVTLRVMDNRNMYSAPVSVVVQAGSTVTVTRALAGRQASVNATVYSLDGRRIPAEAIRAGTNRSGIVVRRTVAGTGGAARTHVVPVVR